MYIPLLRTRFKQQLFSAEKSVLTRGQFVYTCWPSWNGAAIAHKGTRLSASGIASTSISSWAASGLRSSDSHLLVSWMDSAAFPWPSHHETIPVAANSLILH